MTGSGAALLHFVEHVAHARHPQGAGLRVEAARCLRDRRAHGADDPRAFWIQRGAHALKDVPAQFQNVRRGVAGHQRDGAGAQIGAGEPQRERKRERTAAHVENERLVGNAAEIESGQQRGEAHEVPGQKIAQIGRGQTGGSPVGAAQAVAFRGEQRRKIAAGHGEVAFLGTVHGHDAVENEEQLFQPAPGEAVGSRKERCDHGKSCAEKGCRKVAERVA